MNECTTSRQVWQGNQSPEGFREVLLVVGSGRRVSLSQTCFSFCATSTIPLVDSIDAAALAPLESLRLSRNRLSASMYSKIPHRVHFRNEINEVNYGRTAGVI